MMHRGERDGGVFAIGRRIDWIAAAILLGRVRSAWGSSSELCNVSHIIGELHRRPVQSCGGITSHAAAATVTGVFARAVFSAGPFILLTVLLLWLSYLILDPNSPRTVAMATGAEQGAYAEFGRAQAAELARFGIKVELRPTAGGREPALLRDPNSGVILHSCKAAPARPSTRLTRTRADDRCSRWAICFSSRYGSSIAPTLRSVPRRRPR